MRLTDNFCSSMLLNSFEVVYHEYGPNCYSISKSLSGYCIITTAQRHSIPDPAGIVQFEILFV